MSREADVKGDPFQGRLSFLMIFASMILRVLSPAKLLYKFSDMNRSIVAK